MKKITKILILISLLGNTAFAETFNYRNEFNAWWNAGVNNQKNYHPAMKKLRNQVDNAIKQADIKLLPWYNAKKYQNIFSNWQKKAFGSAYTVSNDLPKLHKFVEDLCNKNNISKPFIVIPPFQTVINAAAGKLFRENGVIFIFPGIINNTNDEELEAIIAHEIGHIKHNHINKILAFTYPTLICSFAAFNCLLAYCLRDCDFFETLSKKDLKELTKAIPKISAALSGFTYVILKKLVIGKKFEKEADKFAMDNGHANGIKSFMAKINSQDSFAETLKYIEENKASLTKDDYRRFKNICKWAEFENKFAEFWDEHPTEEERIKAAEEYLNKNNQVLPEEIATA